MGLVRGEGGWVERQQEEGMESVQCRFVGRNEYGSLVRELGVDGW